MPWPLMILFAVVGVVVVDRALLALESRGLINWRKTDGRGAAGTALMTMQEFVEPQAAALVEVQRVDEERQDDDDADDDNNQKRRV